MTRSKDIEKELKNDLKKRFDFFWFGESSVESGGGSGIPRRLPRPKKTEITLAFICFHPKSKQKWNSTGFYRFVGPKIKKKLEKTYFYMFFWCWCCFLFVFLCRPFLQSWWGHRRREPCYISFSFLWDFMLFLIFSLRMDSFLICFMPFDFRPIFFKFPIIHLEIQ